MQNIQKTCENLRKTMNEDSRGPRRNQRGRGCVPKSQDILYGRKHSKDKEKGVYAHENDTHAPRASSMRLGHAPCTQGKGFLHSCTKPCTWGMLGVGQNCFFPIFKCKNSNFQALTQVETKSIYSTPLINNFSFRTKWFKRKGRTESLKGGVSPHSKSLAYVLFLL